MKVAVSGLRPAQFDDLAENNIKPLIEEAFDTLGDRLLTDIVSGLISGVEHLAAEQAYERGLPVHVILACPTQAGPWPLPVQVRFLKLLQQADSLRFAHESRHKDYFMQDQLNLILGEADLALTFLNRRDTGNCSLLGKAVYQGIPVINCNPFTERWEGYREGHGWRADKLSNLIKDLKDDQA